MDKFEKNINKSIIDSFYSSLVPDVKNQILTSSKLKKKAKRTNKTKLTISLLVPTLSFSFALIIILPILNKNNVNNSSNDGPVTVTEVNNKNNQIAFSILSAENMISSYQNVTVPSFGTKNLINGNALPAPPGPYDLELSEELFNEELTNINPYMFTAECMVNTTISSNYTIAYYENSDYQYVMTIKETSEENIKFYYNETIKPHEDDEYILEGYFDINGTKYNVRGEKEIDNEEDDNEREDRYGKPHHDDGSEYELDIEIDLNNGYLLCVYHEIETNNNESKEIYKFAYVNKKVNHGRDEIQEFVSIKFISGKRFNSNVEIERYSLNSPVSLYSLSTSSEEDYEYLLNYRIMDNKNQYFGNIHLDVLEEEEYSYYLYTESKLNYSIKLKRN